MERPQDAVGMSKEELEANNLIEQIKSLLKDG